MSFVPSPNPEPSVVLQPAQLANPEVQSFEFTQTAIRRSVTSRLFANKTAITTVQHHEFDLRALMNHLVDNFPLVAQKLPEIEYDFFLSQEIRKIESWRLRALVEKIASACNPIPDISNWPRSQLENILAYFLTKNSSGFLDQVYTNISADSVIADSSSLVGNQFALRRNLFGRQLKELNSRIELSLKKKAGRLTELANAVTESPVVPKPLRKRDNSPKRT